MRTLSAKITKDLIASFGRPMPLCPNCNSRTVMSCREAYPAEPVVFTFECRKCRLAVIQWTQRERP
jgi:hypothetical protein